MAPKLSSSLNTPAAVFKIKNVTTPNSAQSEFVFLKRSQIKVEFSNPSVMGVGQASAQSLFSQSLQTFNPIASPASTSPFFESALSFQHGEGNGTPLQYSCLENPRDGGAWWAAVCGVAQSWTRLKRSMCMARGSALLLSSYGRGI